MDRDLHLSLHGFAPTPTPPYVAIIFTFRRRAEGLGDAAYAQMVRAIVEHGQNDPAYLGFEAAEGRDGMGIVTHYLADADAATRFQREADVLIAAVGGRDRWFSEFIIRHAAVLRDAVSAASKS